MTVDSKTQLLALQSPNIPFTIRPVQMTDLRALRKECWEHRSITRSREHLKAVLKANNRERGLGIVVEHPTLRQLIAYGQYLTLPKCVEISDLIVSKTFRSQGIGTAMIQYLIHAMSRNTSHYIEIGVAASNPRALALYQRLGFTMGYEIMLNLGKGRETVIYLRLEMAS